MPDEKPVPETLDTLAERITALSASVDKRFDDVDKRFDDVDKRFDDVDKRFDGVDKRFDGVDKRFDGVDKRFDDVTDALVEQRQYTEFAFDRLRDEMLSELGNTRTEMKAGFSKLDRKLDRVLSALSGTSSPRRRRRT